MPEAMEEEGRLRILSIAGFDPSGGAGILADIKTFESNKVYGLGVCTAITFQNDKEFEGVNWISSDEIIQQIAILIKRFSISWAKIGLIENFETLEKVIDYLIKNCPGIKVIWDPILKASAGFVFHKETSRERLLSICKKIYLITPNLEEIQQMIPEMTPESGADYLGKNCNVLLKGGHGEDTKVRDLLFEKSVISIFESERINSSKRGTGCVLSAAILTNLAKGYTLKEACREGKEYVTDFINSDTGLLGFHYV